MKPLSQNSLIQNRYLIVHLIGKGGMGEVYLAVDQRLGSAVALKRTYFADDEMLGNAFEREAKTLARLRHPVLPKVSDHFTENGEQYLVMEHIAGDDLSKRLEIAQKPFPVSWVLYWADQLLDALAYLHSHEPPIIHRDIKPQNLKLTDENHIILLDFGLSKNTGQSMIANSGSSGSVVGYTPHYAPMEQIRGTGTNPRSDLYSLSATLYQLVTNVVPADALTRADALLNGTADPIEPLFELNPEISRDVSDVILRGMEVSQEKRFPNAKDMQRSLRKAFTEMQEAMTAQTVAFVSPEKYSSKIERPGEDGHSDSRDQNYQSGESEEATRIRGGQPATPAPVDAFGGFVDPTVEYASGDSAPRQSDIKTEVYQGGEAPLYQPVQEVGNAANEPAPDFFTTSVTNDRTQDAGEEGGYSPESTVPIIAFTNEPATAGFENLEVSAGAASDPFATRTAAPSFPPADAAARPFIPAPAKKKSKAGWIIGGLAAMFFLAVFAAGAGWFVYSNYLAAGVQPTPSPEPTLEFTPSPEPTFEAVFDSNTNTATDQSNSNTNSEVTIVEPTPVPEADRGETNSVQRPTPQIGTRKTPTRTGTPQTVAKPTPKRTPDRTVILQ